MKPISLCYHDVLADASEMSGFPGPDASTYKLAIALFREHLQAIAVADTKPATAAPDQAMGLTAPLLTFDDGGASAVSVIAGELERHGKRGLFFIPTNFIGKPGFVTADQIRALHERGHVIGSHSCSHRGRMSRHTPERLRDEWSISSQILSSITGAPVVAASVPCGYYSAEVGRQASRAGLRYLFTQEPVTRTQQAEACLVIGRYTVRSATPAKTIQALASGGFGPQFRQWTWWTLKRFAKSLGGSLYTALRTRYFHLRGVEATFRP